ncbi:DUF3105 domain-containing protein [Chondromyces apiculatus]|uniref:Putative lipoprotein n=1 Tax=Chondromyces apiculatus DSM 436 TaxID=1192034 RepID=A0A017TG34_9BACT|nr:DUF3105 domain-containing protein [Chondromyces apiculatus]EYF07790.1 putative lipoprotein [Chondromyces apiculatus DSM 436]
MIATWNLRCAPASPLACVRALACVLLSVAGLILGGCGDDGSEDGNTATETPTGAEVVTLHPDAEPLPGETACTVTIVKGIPPEPAVHEPVCTALAFATNPPSSGNHWPNWAAFKRYTVPVERALYVHDQEHGGVVLSYRCPEGCPDVVAALEQAMDARPEDTLCSTNIPRVPNRLLLTPDPLLPTPIAASAWGATYTATCIDAASLGEFLEEFYGKGPETTCAAGIDVAETNGTLSACQP